jgi:hypothetical protein
MITKFFALFLVLWLLTDGSIYAGAQDNQKDEPLIYAVVIEELFAGKKLSDKPIKLLLLENQTRFDDFEGDKAITAAPNSAPMFTGLKPDTIQSLIRQNSRPYPLTNPAKTSLKVQLIDGKIAQETVQNNRWQKLYADHPDCSGIVSFSKVGFDKDGKQALVYVAHVYGEDAGRGTILFLQKTGQQWKVQAKAVNWVSTG